MAYGTVNADVIQSSVANTSLGAGNASIMKNRIINGAMVIDQRNAGASVSLTTPATYVIDRWSFRSNTSITVQRSTTTTTGFINSAYITVPTGATSSSSHFNIMQQSIEGFNIADLGWGAAGAKTVTLSFWVRSTQTGTFAGSLRNGAGDRSYVFNYTISSANTWTQASITVAGDTTGTWATDNTAGITVTFDLGSGSTFATTANAWAAGNYVTTTGAVQLTTTSSANLYITGVQLEVGSYATGFEYRQYGTELALCQRYFQSYGGVSANDMVCMGLTSSTSLSVAILQLPVTMRTSPSVGYSSTSALIVDDNGAAGTSSAISTSSLGLTSIYFTVTTGATLVANRPARIYTNGSGARLTWSAEL